MSARARRPASSPVTNPATARPPSGPHAPQTSHGAGARHRPRARSTGLPASTLVAVGILCSALPLRGLFDGQGWLWRLAIVLAAVGLTGPLTRPRWSPPRVLLAQAAAYLVALVTLFHGNTLAFGVLPTPGTLVLWNDLLVEVGRTLREHAAPAPQTPGVVFLLTGAIGAIGWAADTLAVTLRRPALAGLAMLAPFLTAVANGDGGLHPGYFAATAGCWLAVLAVADRQAVLAWGRDPAGATPGRPVGAGRVAGAGTRAGATGVLGAGAIVLALVIAATLPHLPVRYLADGFGTGGLGGGRGQVGFSPSAQMVQDLEATQGRPILHYRTDDPAPPPLRVAVSTEYASGTWWPQEDGESPSATPPLRYPLGWRQDAAAARQYRMEVERNRLVAPYLAAPPDVIEGRVYDAHWAQGRTTGVLRVDEPPSRYELTYLDIDPDPQTLRGQEFGTYPRSVQEALDSSPVSALVAQTAQEVTARTDGSPYGQAIAIQEWLRSGGGFTYSLQLAPAPPGLSQEEIEARAVDLFLESKRGYCVQFTTAMVLMARSLGIPARAATGFLPGSVVDGVREVVPSDAHAWPELYFDGVGWLRFEPTPGSRSGAPPEYTVAQEDDEGATASPGPTTATPTPTEPAANRERPQQDIDMGAQAVDAPDEGRGRWRIAGALLLLALICVVPVAAARSRRARAAAGRDPADRVEFWWQDLLERLDDLGIEVDAAQTLGEQRSAIRTAAALRGEPDEALTRLCDTVRTARYAPPGALAPDVALRAEEEAVRVRRAVARARGPVQRARALLWPGAGVLAMAQAAGSLRPTGARRGRPGAEQERRVAGHAEGADDPRFTGRPARPAGGRRSRTRDGARPGSGSGPG